MEINEKFLNIERTLNNNYVERDQEIHNAILTIISRMTHLLYGPPGTAKSAIVRAICSHIEGAKYFYTLMFPELPPDAILGPINPMMFKKGEFKRNVEGYLPSAHLAFIDEVFRASSNVLNSLFNIMNEREFKNGSELINVPCFALFFACNKVNEKADPAFMDRFYLKSNVRRVQRPDHVAEIINSWQGTKSLRTDKSTNFVEKYIPNKNDMISVEEVDEATRKSLEINCNSKAIKSATSIYTGLNQTGFDVSERKIKLSMRIAAAEAYLEGSEKIGPGHLVILLDTLPNFPHQINQVADVVLTHIDERLAEIYRLWQKLTDDYSLVLSERERNEKWQTRCSELASRSETVVKNIIRLNKQLPKGSEGQSVVKKRAEDIEQYSRYIKSHLFTLSNADLQEAAKLI